MRDDDKHPEHSHRLVSRRNVLVGLGASALLTIYPRFASAAASVDDRRLLVVLLRGAMDGLHLLPPIGDPAYARVRGALWPKLRALTTDKPLASLGGVTPVPRGTQFLKQPLRAEVLFGGWTGSGQLRHARFLGLSDRQPTSRRSRPVPQARPTGPNGGMQTPVTHADRIVYPADNFTKGEIVAYYERIADRILPYLEGRLVSIVRAPENIDKETFFQRRPMKGMTRGIVSIHDGDCEYIAIEGAEGLRTAAQPASCRNSVGPDGRIRPAMLGPRLPNMRSGVSNDTPLD